jgi:hypothetical protein
VKIEAADEHSQEKADLARARMSRLVEIAQLRQDQANQAGALSKNFRKLLNVDAVK